MDNAFTSPRECGRKIGVRISEPDFLPVKEPSDEVCPKAHEEEATKNGGKSAGKACANLAFTLPNFPENSRWVIDRIEEGWAVLENAAMDTVDLPQASLPEGTQPGDTLVWQNNTWHFDHAETASRAQRIRERLARIRAANPRRPLT